MYGNKPPEGAQYFCRGCGEALPPDWHGQFHPECLKRDKMLRTQEKRRLEREKMLQLLDRQRCPQCGSAFPSATLSHNFPAAVEPGAEPRRVSHPKRSSITDLN